MRARRLTHAPACPAGRNRYVATLKKLAEAYKGKPYSYLWAEGGVQEKLEANFGVGGFGYPGGS